MFRFRMEIAGEVQLDRGIARFSEGVSDYRAIWPIISDDFYSQEKRQFESQGAAGSLGQWKELSPAYRGWKEAKYPGMPILQRTGKLFRSLTSANAEGAVFVPTRKTLTLGSSVPYGIYHQSPAPRRVLPRRPEVDLTEAFNRRIMHHMQVYLVQIGRQAGFRSGENTFGAAVRRAGRNIG
jgi:phage gpG-like protein